MFRKIFLQALLSGTLAALAAVIYNRIYFFATEADYSKVLSVTKLIAGCLLITMLAAFLHYGLTRAFKKRGELVFNFLFSIISFAAVLIPISVSLPLDVHFPELFPGLAVPLVFFPAMAWYTVNPLFTKTSQTIP
jgi:hypothetical protein